MPLNLDSCIAGVFTPGNIGASSGLPPVVRVVPSLDDEAPVIAEAAAAADTLDFFTGELLAEAASASDSYAATGGAYVALVAESAAAVDAPLVHEPGDLLTGVTETAGADSVQDATGGGISASIIEAASASDAPDWQVLGPPAILTGLIGWWDASVTASLSLTGSSINSVADQSGGGNTMNWANAKPTYSATGFNSNMPAIVLGSSSSLIATPFPMGTGSTLTAWYVGTVGGGSANDRALDYFKPGGADWNNAQSWAISKGSGTILQLNRGGPVVSTPSLTAHPAPYRIIATIDSSGKMLLYANGVAAPQQTQLGNWVSAGTAQIGRQDAGSGYWTGPIAEAGIATGYSDATTVAALDTYLKNKWGL